MSSPSRITIRADAAPGMGGGHVLRCLTLADALARRGAAVTFVCASIPEVLETRIRAAGHHLVKLPTPLPATREQGWEKAQLAADLQQTDAEATIAACGGAAWTVVDHYLLDSEWDRIVRSASKLLVIDDLANRAHDCDLLLDQNLARDSRDYGSLLPLTARPLIGPVFALLRPEFAVYRAASLRRRQDVRPVERVLIATGTADIGGASLPAARIVLRRHPRCRIDIVVGSIAATVDDLRALARSEPRVSVHVDTDRMAELLSGADLAVGGAGTSAWERCCLGVPSVVLSLAANQRDGAQALAASGAALVADDEFALSDQLQRLIEDPALRARLIAASAAVTDGLGAERVAEIVAGNVAASGETTLSIRAAALRDAEILWAWRNDPLTRAVSQSSAPVPWPGHAAWLERTLASPASRLFIVEQAERPIAMVRMDQAGGEPPSFTVSINMAPHLRGAGFGRSILAAGCRKLLEDEGPARLEAVIRNDNEASRRIFEALGFEPVREGLGEEGFERYLRPEELFLNGLSY